MAVFLCVAVLQVGCASDDAGPVDPSRNDHSCEQRVSEMRQQYATVTEQINLTQVQLDKVNEGITSAGRKSGTMKHLANGALMLNQGPSLELFRRRNTLEDRLIELRSTQAGLSTELKNLDKGNGSQP